MSQSQVPGTLAPLLAAVLLVGCDGESAVPESSFVRDSAGVRIVENAAPAWAEGDRWIVGREPTFSLAASSEEGDAALHRVVTALRVGDGGVVVGDGGSSTLRWYDRSGDLRSTAGGAGGGPGEFRALSWAGISNDDSLHVWDTQARRVSVYRNGAFVRDYGIELEQQWIALTVAGVLSDGRLVATPVAIPGGQGGTGVHRPSLPVWVLEPDGSIGHELGAFPGRAVEFRPTASPNEVIRYLPPFGPTTLVAVGAGLIVVADNAEYALRVYDTNGTLKSILRVAASPAPVLEDDLARELERRLESAPPVEEIRAGIRANFDATTPAEFKPFFDRLLVDADGYLWVRREGGTGEADSVWEILAPDGRLLGGVTTPAAFELTDPGRDFLLGTWTDDYGVEDVRMLELDRNDGSGSGSGD